MIGSAVVAAWIAHAAFWCLLAWGLATGDLGPRGALIALVLWVAGRVALAWSGVPVFPSFVAAIDVGLVLAIFGGDVRLT